MNDTDYDDLSNEALISLYVIYCRRADLNRSLHCDDKYKEYHRAYRQLWKVADKRNIELPNV